MGIEDPEQDVAEQQLPLADPDEGVPERAQPPLDADPWHSLRARTMADDLGLAAWTSPTRSGPIGQTRTIQARYLIRESAALLHYRLTHAPAETSGTDLG